MSKKTQRRRDNRSRAGAPPAENGSAKPLIAVAGKWLIVGMAVLLIIGGAWLFLADRNSLPKGKGKSSLPAAQYVGAKACAGCHVNEYQAWRGSHHDLAMQEATEQTVLGNFANAKFVYAGVTSRFFKRDGKFFVNTDGADGRLADYEIKYSFGVTPLQQYLIPFPGGRLQALGIAWDSRPKENGGQRWFHLYPKEKITHKEPLHWTGIDQNWNYQCAECHSTNLQKRYDAEKAIYDTTWSEINVACEACHGPASVHVEWAAAKSFPTSKGEVSSKGFTVSFTERRGITWAMDQTTGIARRSAPRATNIELDSCARCHSRRGVMTETYLHGRPLLDSHLPALLSDGLYYPDGQIQDEVYEYGSFLQSKMHGAGVTCSDCHEPHSLKLRAQGSQVCSQCHAPSKFAAAEHHRHRLGSSGADCLGCHMPQRNYMVVDPRRDHSLRVPRPDLSAKFDAPNACNVCHTDKDFQWAANAFGKWYKPGASPQQRYTEAVHAARFGEPSGATKLAAVAQQISLPAIARATALAELRRYLSSQSMAVVQEGLKDNDAMVRLGALRALEGIDPRSLPAETFGLLHDPVRAVRTTTASLLAGVSRPSLSAAQQSALESALQEYVGAQRTNADRPEAQLNLGLLYMRKGEFDKAENHYRQALKLQPSFAPAAVNLADMFRARERDREGEKVLREALSSSPEVASVAHALGLLLVREKRLDEAITWLKRAAEQAPGNPRYAYVYAVALNSTGQANDALALLARAHQRHPNDRELLYALVTMNRDAGKVAAAQSYAEKLAAAAPNDPVVTELLKQLQR